MIKVVTTEEMKRIEEGASVELLMLEAGKKIAAHARKYGKKIILLVGKGNKGGDAYAAGRELEKLGADVRAIPLYPPEECSPLNQKFGNGFPLAEGFDCDSTPKNGAFFGGPGCELLIDGLLGTGFHGPIEGPLAKLIARANQSGKPILSIDIPSGLNGSTGAVSPHTIIAKETVTLGLPKIGLFLNGAWNYVGKLHIEELPLPIEEAKPVAYVPDLRELHLPPQARDQHKYSRGFVLGFGGSAALKGAAKLSGLSALHAGAGIVKIFSLEEIGEAANELICQLFDEKLWNEALTKAGALFIGPGLGRTTAVKQWLETHVRSIEQPCVIDADALFFLKEFPTYSILTPHSGEMAHLLENTDLRTPQEFVDVKQAIVILKGAPTWILSPKQLPVIIPHGDPGMATAGSGDVLTGILAALLAQGMTLKNAAILGATIHALAGEAAAREKTSYGYSASDLIEFLPEALNRFL